MGSTDAADRSAPARDRSAPPPVASQGQERGDYERLHERIARVIYAEGGYCGDCSYDGWDTCDVCTQTLLGYSSAVLDAIFGAQP